MRTVLLAGGTGGARLAAGLAATLPPGDLTVIANTGDDLEFSGLLVQPDLDSVLYHLTGRISRQRGWGVEGDTFEALSVLRELDGDTWFQVGDRDLGLHLLRHRMLAQGFTPTEIALDLCRKLRLHCDVLPMADEPVRTVIHGEEREYELQEWFVRERAQPRVRAIEYRGAATAALSRQVRRALDSAELLVIGPSNPFISILPILSVPELYEAWRRAPGKRIAVSPLVGGRALKGPTDRLAAELGYETTVAGVAHIYRDAADVVVIDASDVADAGATSLPLVALDTVMSGGDGERRLAGQIVEWAAGPAVLESS